MTTPLSLDDARARIASAIEPVDGIERVPLAAALGRVVATDLRSGVAVPAHDNAAMDGYAIRADVAAPRVLRVVGQARAGRPFRGRVAEDACVRIMTGAVLPADCDAVVAQEDVQVDGDRVTFPHAVEAGHHRRRAGEDLAVGALVLARGRRITPSDIGLAASIGVSRLDVVRRLRVAVFSTGDELRDVDESVDEPGTIRDANRYTIVGMLQTLGVDAIDLGIVKDDPAALEAAMLRGAAEADAIVTSGGVSVGDADHTRDVLARIGDVAFWSLAVRPGRPMAFGRIAHGARAAWLFALPGNPVAVMVVFHALVRDALARLAGATIEPRVAITAIAETPIAKSRGRTDFVRGIASRRDEGWHVRPTGHQGSGILRSMSEANCLVVLAHDRGPVAAGEVVEAWPFHGLA